MEASAFRFFHDQLPDDRHRAFYDAVEAAVRERRKEIICPRSLGMDGSDYVRILEHVYDDHPEFFSFFPLRSEVSIQPLSVAVRPFYRYSEQTQRKYEAALEKAVTDILRQCFPGGFGSVPELRREKLLFDWITRNVVYDHNSLAILDAGLADEEVRSTAWNAYGALVLRQAVCEGIACAFKLLCNRVGLPSIVALGNAGGERHAWNLVRVHGKFYHVDCTWDLRSSISTRIPYARYRYFNLPDRIISATHTAETAFLPVCGSLQYNPFRIRGLCAFRPEEIDQIAIQQADRGQDRFAVMTVGFRAADCKDRAGMSLAGHVRSRVRRYIDKSGYFIGFTIEGKRGARRG